MYYVRLLLFCFLLRAVSPQFFWSWQLSSSAFDLRLSFLIDLQAKTLIMLVLFISLCVFSFRESYLPDGGIRFYGVLLSFVSSMVVLIAGRRFVSILIGWDGLGVTSFILITHYDTTTNIRSAIVTFISNRLGDAVLIGFLVYYVVNGTTLLFHLEGVIFTLWIIAARTKSAQFPFRAWLPLAIDAPTPVSALVHRRTLVTAGLCLLSRVTEGTSSIISYIGALTFVLGAFCCCLASDLKKCVAYSTLANLGIIMTALGLGAKWMIIFHLITHALFKAGLFIISGKILINRHGRQDLRSVRSDGNLSKVLIVYFTLRSLGLVFIRTFFSKHNVINLLINTHRLSFITLLITSVGVILSAVYSFKIIGLLLSPNKKISSMNTPCKPPELALAVGSLLVGNWYNSSWLNEEPFTFSIPAYIGFAIVVLLLGSYGHLGSTTFYLNPSWDSQLLNKSLIKSIQCNKFYIL